MRDMVELLKGVDVETQNQIYEKMTHLNEADSEAFAELIGQAVSERADHMSASAERRDAREARAPKIGEPAPDFNISLLDDDCRVRLSDLRGRPVGLIFGSYT